MKFPYGISDFKKVNTQSYYYCDRTDKIPLLEKSDFQLFIRPRRFGKSLVLSMLENYYDVAKKDEFESIFGNLKIGENPTDLRNSYFILKLCLLLKKRPPGYIPGGLIFFDSFGSFFVFTSKVQNRPPAYLPAK